MNNDLPVVNNIPECDKYLSTFGRKVFDVLLKHYTTGDFTKRKYACNKNTANRHEVSWQRRDEESNSLSGTNINLTNVNYDVDRNSFANEENATNSPNNLRSDLPERESTPAMTRTVENAKGIKYLDLSALNTNINMTPNSSQIANSKNFTFNMSKEIKHNFKLTENNTVLKSTKEVAWEDMLDCEILNVDTCDNVQKSKKVNKTNITRNLNNVFELISHNKKPKSTKRNSIVEGEKFVINEKAKESVVGDNNKVTEHTSPGIKCKLKNKNNSDSTHTVTGVPKKVLKITDKKLKPNFLKRQNTTAINNWLDNIDPTNLVDGIDIQREVLITSAPYIVAENSNDLLQISLENIECQDRLKKRVQAKLVNENGAIKISKPNNINDLTQLLDDENSTPTEMNKINVKRCKLNAPVRSQNPSKNINYAHGHYY